MLISREIRCIVRDIEGHTKSLLPIFREKIIRADRDAIKESMTSNDRVRVFYKRGRLKIRSHFIGFEPLKNSKDKGYVLYPGAFVEAKAYAPIARHLANLGYYAAIATPPFKLSFFDGDLFDTVKKYWQEKVSSWVLSGHSAGGVVACVYANNEGDSNESLKAIVLLASYPFDSPVLSADLSDNNYIVQSIYGTLDGLTTVEEIDNSKKLLPPGTTYVPIEGGNHTQFYYAKELQDGDNNPEISREMQQEIIRASIVEILNKV